MGTAFKTLGLVGILTLSGINSCSKKTEEPSTTYNPPPMQIPQSPRQTSDYTVKTGDFLSRIVYNELGLRGRAIYQALPGIQARNNLGPERDIYQVVNGQLIEGQDGFVDLIYPGERLTLR